MSWEWIDPIALICLAKWFIIFHQPHDFPEIRRFPLLNHHLGEIGRVRSRANLTRLLKSLDDYNSLLSKSSRLGEIPCFFLMVFPWTSRDKCGHITHHQSLSDQDKISLKQPLKKRDQQDYHIFRLGNPNLNLYLPVTGRGSTPKSYPFHPILVFLVGSMIMCLGSC